MKKEQVKVGMVVKWDGVYCRVTKLDGKYVQLLFDDTHQWAVPEELRPLTARERGDAQ